MLTSPRRQALLYLSFTAILLGYWLIWLPGPVAGLQLIGLEMGEWVKFLPEVRAGQISASRNLFYVPPLLLGLLMAFSTAHWPNRWQTWLVRLLAVAVAWLAFPSLDAIRFEPRSEWLLRLVMIGVVMAVAVGSHWLRRRFAAALPIILTSLALAGALLPTWAYLAMRPAIMNALARPVGFGPGLWLNGIGFMIAAAIFLSQIKKTMPGIVSSGD